MTLSPWWLLPAAVPILWIGELLVARARWIARFDLPGPIVGGMLAALLVLAINVSQLGTFKVQSQVTSAAWSWIVTAEPQMSRPTPGASTSAPAAQPPAISAPPTSTPATQVPSTATPTTSASPASVPATSASSTQATAPYAPAPATLPTAQLASPLATSVPATVAAPVAGPRPIEIYLPFSTAFFTCVGLTASWSIVRKGSWQLLLLLAIATGLAFLQNVIGIALAKLCGAPAALGIACGSLTLTGGPGTALGRVKEFEEAGLAGAGAISTAAAMFGIVAASILAGFVGGQIIRLRKLRSEISELPSLQPSPRLRGEGVSASPSDAAFAARANASSSEIASGASAPSSPAVVPHRPSIAHRLLSPLFELARPGSGAALHIALLLLCLKAGAWLSYGWDLLASHHGWKMKFPVYMGAMVTAIIMRNLIDLSPAARMVRPATIDALGTVTLRLFLAMAIASQNLLALRAVAGPMVLILLAQVVVAVIFCALITYPLMGKDYDAAIMAGGHVGFGLGVTPNAVASMNRLIEQFGPAPRALLVATIVGAFLIDIPNAFLISYQLGWIHL